jgi:hypothetical protein
MSNNDKVFVNSDNKMLHVAIIQENSSQIHIKLNGVDYRVWSKIMEMYIIGHMKKAYITRRDQVHLLKMVFDEWESHDALIK